MSTSVRLTLAARQLLSVPKLINLNPKKYGKKCAPIYNLRIALCEERDHVLSFLRKHFYKDEPLRMGASPFSNDVNDENFHLESIPQRKCILAVKPDETIIAVVIAGVRRPYQLDNMANRHWGKWSKVLKFWARIEKDSKFFKRFSAESTLHAYLVAVHRDYRGCGLCARMLQELENLGRRQKMDMMSIDATSVFAACACKRLGMRLVNTLVYGNYMDDKGLPIFVPPKCHDAVRTYIQHL